MLYSNHHFSDNFCQAALGACQENLQTQTTFNLVAMPGVGVTFFLQALAQPQPESYLFINSYEMHDFTKESVYQQLAHKLGLEEATPSLQSLSRALAEKTQQLDQLVIVFNRLDRLSEILDQHFYDNIRYLRDASRQKIVIIFVSSRPMLELSASGLKDVLSLVTKTTYFPGYSDEDLIEIAQATGMSAIEKTALQLAGGHHALSQVLARCQNLANPMSDPMVELLIKDLYYGLDTKRRKQLEAFALKGVLPTDPFLVGAGYVRDNQVFTPLMTEYITHFSKLHLPLKEKRLLRLLLLHKGKLVDKEMIADYVWREEDGVVSDWALNALIYRLRRHPAFDGQRYTIESRKKAGYVLYDHSA